MVLVVHSTEEEDSTGAAEEVTVGMVTGTEETRLDRLDRVTGTEVVVVGSTGQTVVPMVMVSVVTVVE